MLPPDNLPAKRNKSKLPKAKVVSRIVVDYEKTKYAEIVEALVDKPAEELNYPDYKFTKIELGKQSWLGSLQDAQDALINLSKETSSFGKRKI